MQGSVLRSLFDADEPDAAISAVGTPPAMSGAADPNAAPGGAARWHSIPRGMLPNQERVAQLQSRPIRAARALAGGRVEG